jgi:hypothetical protein
MSSYPTTNITNPGPHDILCGRGGGTTAHPGNIKFRKLVAAHKLRYLAASKSDKPAVAREVVKEWRSLNPPGRFLAKMEENNNDSSGDQPCVWFDVGDKKAREKASQCLRERNGAANEAVQALVKTVTANGEACPEDYATLMNKAAMVKARNDIALQQQKEMLSQMAQMAEFSGNFKGNGMGGDEPQPYGLSEKMLNEYASRGNDNYGGYNDYSNRGNNSGRGFNSDNFQQQFDQFQQNSNQNQFRGQMNNMSNNYQTEDEFIEAEIKRMLQQKQAQLQMAQQQLSNGGMGAGNNMGNNMGGGNNMGNMGGGNNIENMSGGNMRNMGMNSGMGGSSGRNMGGFNNDPQPYMGEESIMKEYMQLMQKQHHLNMNGGLGNNGIGNVGGMSGFNGMNGMNNMGNQMNNMPQSNMNDSDEWLWNVANGRSNNNSMMSSSMGFNNNSNFRQNNMNNSNMNNMASDSNRMQDGGFFSPNSDAARNYLNRLRGMRKGDNNSNPDSTYSGGGNNNMMGGMMMNEQIGSSMMGGQAGQGQGGSGGLSGGRGFTIEEYQASLQEFLSNDGDGGYDNKPRNNSVNQDTNNFKNNFGGEGTVFQVPTSLGDKNTTSNRSGRDSMQSIGTFARNTFQSVDSNCHRKSFESVDDMDVRPTFRSVDTMDMMSITNSINDIVDDDVLRNPEMREKYAKRRLSQDDDGEGRHKFELATLEVKTMDHGQGGGRPKKIDSIDPRLIAMSGAKHTVQTKQDDGPGRAEKRSSMASVDSRMSFGNM